MSPPKWRRCLGLAGSSGNGDGASFRNNTHHRPLQTSKYESSVATDQDMQQGLIGIRLSFDSMQIDQRPHQPLHQTAWHECESTAAAEHHCKSIKVTRKEP